MKAVALVALALLVALIAATVRIVPGRDVGAARPVQTGQSAPRFIVPVRGVKASDLINSWQDPRDGGARVHQGLDIMAARGTPVLASAAGRVEKLFQSNAGGTTVYIRSNGVMAYYAHLAGYAPGLAEGAGVRAGQVIGYVGDTGNAGAGNYHLHFALARMRTGDRWWEGEPVNPYPLLAANGAPR